MNRITKNGIGLIILIAIAAISCQPKTRSSSDGLFFRDNLVAWCVVPFDSMERTPAQRAQMLSELGFSRFAYDWRTKHIPEFQVEIDELKARGIQLTGVWIWIDSDSLPGDENAQIFKIVKDNGIKTDFWIGFNNVVFDGLEEDKKIEKAVSMIRTLEKMASDQGCTISLYNHGDWFGEPSNQIKIIEQIGSDKIGMVYNFHHAHEQIAAFPALLNQMMPYLKTVNINGMRAEGPKILPLGQGNTELEMLKLLRDSGFRGHIGILGHVEDADVRVILQGNLDGLKTLLQTMGEEKALATYE